MAQMAQIDEYCDILDTYSCYNNGLYDHILDYLHYKLKQLPKLTKEQIATIERIEYKIFFYFYYCYFKTLYVDSYNIYIEKWYIVYRHIVRLNKTKYFTYLKLKLEYNELEYGADDYFIEAAKGGRLNSLKYILKNSKDINVYTTDRTGWNAYYYAIYYGNIKIMKYLESQGYNINYGQTYLIAARYGNIKTLKYLQSRKPIIRKYYEYSYIKWINYLLPLYETSITKYWESRCLNINKKQLYRPSRIYIINNNKSKYLYI
jgi:hypothetical protein